MNSLLAHFTVPFSFRDECSALHAIWAHNLWAETRRIQTKQTDEMADKRKRWNLCATSKRRVRANSTEYLFETEVSDTMECVTVTCLFVSAMLAAGY